MTSARAKELRDIARGIADEIGESNVQFSSGLFPTLRACQNQAGELAEALNALSKGLERLEARRAAAESAAAPTKGGAKR